MRAGVRSGGYHNHNYVLPLTEDVARLVGRDKGTRVTVRIRRMDALPVVIRTWPEESAVLDAVQGVLPHVPECLATGNDFAIHSYVEGTPLSGVCGDSEPVGLEVVRALTGLLARTARVGRAALPPLPALWPADDMDSRGYLRTLVRLADLHIRQPNWRTFGGLFAALGIPQDALSDLAARVPEMAERPYGLLHADLHRDNVITTRTGSPPLICVDWELATYGDPLHDLATHLVRMRYPEFQWDEVTAFWAQAMEPVRPAAVRGLAEDLRHYVDFERAQSVYPDVMRAARSLEDTLDDKGLDEATLSVWRALEAAAEPLRLSSVPSRPQIERVLVRWAVSRAGNGLAPAA
nr:aminoglycoside phosphotransferase family protein [Streptomyces caeruleatus]